jgi:hypothetical protein
MAQAGVEPRHEIDDPVAGARRGSQRVRLDIRFLGDQFEREVDLPDHDTTGRGRQQRDLDATEPSPRRRR